MEFHGNREYDKVRPYDYTAMRLRCLCVLQCLKKVCIFLLYTICLRWWRVCCKYADAKTSQFKRTCFVLNCEISLFYTALWWSAPHLLSYHRDSDQLRYHLRGSECMAVLSVSHIAANYGQTSIIRRIKSRSFKFYRLLSQNFAFCVTRTDPRPAVRPAEGPNSFHWNVKLEVLSCCTKFHEPHDVLECVHF